MAYVTCSECRGYGVVEEWRGDGCDVVDCRTCRGSGEERERDERGRFV